VLDALAYALRLDDAERAHIFDLARASRPSLRKRRLAAAPNLRPSVQWMLDSMTTAAAFASNGRLDVLSANQLGRALYAPLFRDGPDQPNWARFVFLNRDAHEIYVDWDRAAKETVALLRLQAGGNPHDRALTDLIGELATKSDEFRVLWAAHNVRLHTKGRPWQARRVSRQTSIAAATASRPVHLREDPRPELDLGNQRREHPEDHHEFAVTGRLQLVAGPSLPITVRLARAEIGFGVRPAVGARSVIGLALLLGGRLRHRLQLQSLARLCRHEPADTSQPWPVLLPGGCHACDPRCQRHG
jgi:hypothetical protein